jgi:hypothetical protein
MRKRAVTTIEPEFKQARIANPFESKQKDLMDAVKKDPYYADTARSVVSGMRVKDVKNVIA